LLSHELVAQFSPPGPNLRTDAADFAVWAVNIAGAVFLIPHFMSFIGALVDRFQYHRFVMAGRLPANFKLTPYVETKAVFAEALFLVMAAAFFIVTLNEFNQL
jgi:hypothetical protein